MKFTIVLGCLAVLAAMASAAPPRPLINMSEQGFVLPMMMRDYGSIVEAETPKKTLKSADYECVWENMCKDTACTPVKVCSKYLLLFVGAAILLFYGILYP